MSVEKRIIFVKKVYFLLCITFTEKKNYENYNAEQQTYRAINEFQNSLFFI